MKDAVVTVRVPAATRRRIERLAQREGRSLSQQIERLIDQSLAAMMQGARPTTRAGRRGLAGSLSGGRVPTWEELKQARLELSSSLRGRIERHAKPGR